MMSSKRLQKVCRLTHQTLVIRSHGAGAPQDPGTTGSRHYSRTSRESQDMAHGHPSHGLKPHLPRSNLPPQIRVQLKLPNRYLTLAHPQPCPTTNLFFQSRQKLSLSAILIALSLCILTSTPTVSSAWISSLLRDGHQCRMLRVCVSASRAC